MVDVPFLLAEGTPRAAMESRKFRWNAATHKSDPENTIPFVAVRSVNSEPTATSPLGYGHKFDAPQVVRQMPCARPATPFAFNWHAPSMQLYDFLENCTENALLTTAEASNRSISRMILVTEGQKEWRTVELCTAALFSVVFAFINKGK
jgi:hypothetical protein